MNLHEAVADCRTLLVEGPAQADRAGLLAELAAAGFSVLRPRPDLHRLDPARALRELLGEPGRLALDGGPLRELVYGPLRRGRARVTWIEALDFADAVAERDGALIHVTVGDPSVGDGEREAARRAYGPAVATLAQHVPLVTIVAPAGAVPEHPRRTPRWHAQRPLHPQKLTTRRARGAV